MLNCWCIKWPVGFKRLTPARAYDFAKILQRICVRERVCVCACVFIEALIQSTPKAPRKLRITEWMKFAPALYQAPSHDVISRSFKHIAAIFRLRYLMDVIGRFHAPAVLFPGKEFWFNLTGVGMGSSEKGKAHVAGKRLGIWYVCVRPWTEKNWKVAIFRPTRRSLLPRRHGWTDNLLHFFWVVC